VIAAHRRFLADQAISVKTGHMAERELGDPLPDEPSARKLGVPTPADDDLSIVGRMAGALGHDVGNLMTVFMTLADLIEEAAGPDVAVDELRELRRAAERGTRLVRRLLEFAQQETSGTDRVDLTALLEDLATGLQQQMPSVRLEVEAVGAPRTAWIDPSAVAVAVSGLVTNAAEASDPGDVVSLVVDMVDATAPKRPQTSARHRRSHVRIRVRDRGRGMSPEVARRAFDPLFTTKRRSMGAGLGLPTAYGIVHAVGGSMRLESTPGEGTVATVLLPAGVAPERTATTAPVPRSVLVVEDDPQVRDSIATVLRRRGLTVHTASDPDAALEVLARREPIDAVISDLLLLRDRSGLDLEAELRDRGHHVPVGFMSGDTALETAGRPLLAKPFTGAELAGFVEALAAGGEPA
jgi:signal transduction histidine kinase/CheY-like chemotaxis protein